MPLEGPISSESLRSWIVIIGGDTEHFADGPPIEILQLFTGSGFSEASMQALL